jgi:hypothetical protein
MIICGVSDNSLRERILREPNTNLQKAIELGQASEQTKLHAQQLTEDTEKFTKFTSKSERNKGTRETEKSLNVVLKKETTELQILYRSTPTWKMPSIWSSVQQIPTQK